MTRIKTTATPAIPAFVLYGEADAPADDLLHVETVASRSLRYHWEIEPHVHHGLHQLLWLKRGRAKLALDEWRPVCEGPAVIVVPPGVVHAFRFAPGTEGLVLTLDARALLEGGDPMARQALEALFGEPRVLSLADDDEAVARLDALCQALLVEFRASALAASPVPLWLARAVLWQLAQRVATPPAAARAAPVTGGHRALFTRFLVLVEANYLTHWPVSRYASRLGLSTDRLNRLVRAEAGASALELIHRRLAREACRRLVYVAAPVSRLAQELGFDDPAYFCRFVKRHTGLSPRAYRAQQDDQRSAA